MTSFYSTGTVSVTSGEARIWAEDPALWIPANIKTGDTFQTAEIPPTVIINGPEFDEVEEKYFIDIAFPYGGTTDTGVAYTIVKTSSEWGTNQTLAEETAALIQAFAAGTITEEQLNAAVTAAELAETNAEAAFDQIDALYLGAKSSDPAVDNGGGALVAGQIYYNTSSGLLRLYSGSAWANMLTGQQGIQGVGAGLQYTSMTSTTDADPGGPGNFRFNNTDHSLATKVWLDNTDINNVSQSATIDTWDDTTSTIKGYLFVWNRSNRAIFRLYSVTGAIVDKTGYREVPVTYIAGAGTLSNTTATELVFIPKGDKGDTGAAGQTAGVPLTSSTTTTDADPGTGLVRADNATFLSIANLFIDNVDANSVAITTWLDSLDDVSNANARGYIRFQEPTDPTVFMEFAVVGAVTDGGGYRKVPVSPISGDVPADATSLVAVFAPAGADGTGVDGTDPGILLNFESSTTDGNPTGGGIRANDSTLTSATKLFVSKTNRAGNSIATFLAALDDSTNPTVKGLLALTRNADGAQITAQVTAITDATGYVKVDIQSVDGAASFDNNDPVSFQFWRTGNQGSSGAGTGDVVGGGTSVTGNLVLYTDTTGTAIDDSGIAADDVTLNSNNLSDLDDKQAAFDALSLKGANVASAATIDLNSVTGSLIHITGTTTTTAITLSSGRYRRLIADAAWPITAGANLVLNNGGSNYTCAAGDQVDVFADGTTIRLTITPASGSSPGALPASYLDTDGTLAANSDTKVPSQKAVKAYAQPKSTGLTDLLSSWTPASASGPASIALAEDTDNGSNKVTVKPASSLAADRTFILPDADVTWSDLLTAINALTVAAGGFIRTTGAGAVAAQAIVGTVSQSGGVPTGAIIEYGSNSNGDYTRFADGTQICWVAKSATVAITTARGVLYTSAFDQSWTFPAAFSAAPRTVGSLNTGSGGAANVMSVKCASPTASAVTYEFWASSSLASVSVAGGLFAIGRWF
jgi:hypothetical protein